MARLVALAIALLFTAGCRDRGPGAVANEFVEVLGAYTIMPSASRLETAFGLLDTETQRALEARAREASELLTTPLEPWALFRFDGFVQGQRIVRVEEVEVGEDRARVTVQSAWAIPHSLGGPADAPPDQQLTLVREDGGWRVALPGLIEVR